MSTIFKQVKTSDKEYNDGLILTEPILASFPNNLPPQEVLKKMQFNAFQYESNQKGKEPKLKRRLIKAELKGSGVKYQAKNHVHDANPKDQASDYYVGVFNKDENKVYLIPVNGCYQFTQEIENF